MGKKDKHILYNQYFLSFFIPLGFLLIGFLLVGLRPFGNQNLMAMDGYGQYFPMLRQATRSSGEWSWAGGLGYNQLAASAYYTNSPLWYLLRLIPEKFLTDSIHGVILLRVALSGLSFSFFIKRYVGRFSTYTFAFATAYALSGFSLAFMNQFMWLDLVILLPLVASALLYLWRGGSYLPYTISLALALYTNFYLAYSLCLFTGLWVLYLMFNEKASRRLRLLFFYKYLIASILAAGLVTVVLLPTFLALQQAKSMTTLAWPQHLKFYTLSTFFKHFLPFQKPALEYTGVNIYIGAVTLVWLIAYLLKNTWRKKLLFLYFSIFMILSFHLNYFDFVWHGFHFPNQLPARQSYIFIFILLLFAYKGMVDCPKGYKWRRVEKSLRAVIILFMLVEIMTNSVLHLAAYTWKANHNYYMRYEQGMEEILEEYRPEEHAFYRMEFLHPSHNRGLRYGFYGIGFYSSTMSGISYEFFEALGRNVYAKSVSTNYVAHPVLNNVFGLRYFIQADDRPQDIDGLNLREIGKFDNLTLYENPNYLPLGFAIGEQKVDSLPAQDLLLQEHFSRDNSELTFMELEVVKSNYIKGVITLDEASQLLTSIGGEKGWRIEVDGERVEAFLAFDYLLATELDAGEHSIEFIQDVPGKSAGLAISIFSLGIVSACYILERREKRKKHQSVQEEV